MLQMITTVSPVNIYHHSYRISLSCNENFERKGLLRVRRNQKKSGEKSNENNKDIIHSRSIQQKKKKSKGFWSATNLGAKPSVAISGEEYCCHTGNMEMNKITQEGANKVGCCPPHPPCSVAGNSQAWLKAMNSLFSLFS